MANTYSVDLEASSSQYMYAADSASLSITGDISIEAFVRFESLPSSGNSYVIVMKGQDDGVNEISYFFLYTDNGATDLLRFVMTPAGTYGAGNDKSVTWTASLDTWYHVAVTWKASTKTVKFYVDGAQQGADQTTTDGSIYDSTRRVVIGAERSDTTPKSFFDGLMDEIRIWNVVRTTTEIANNRFVDLNPADNSSLVAYYKLENNYLDETANDNDLTAVGSPTFSTNVPFTTFTRSQVDTVGITDVLTSIRILVKSLVDNIGMTDYLSYSVLLLASLVDSMGITDQRDRAVSFIRGVFVF